MKNRFGNGLFGLGNQNGRGGPRHPSLDNLRSNSRNQYNNRSFPQLPSETRNYANGFTNHEIPSNNSNNNRRKKKEEETVWSFLLAVITGMAGLGCSFGVLTLLTILFLAVRPFSEPTYRRLASQMGEAYFLDAVAFLLPNTRLYLSGDSDVPSPVGTSIIVCNHLMDADWWAILMLGRCVGLRGSLKIFLRNEVLQRSRRPPPDRNGSPDPKKASSTELATTNVGNKTVTFARSNGSSRGQSNSGCSTNGSCKHQITSDLSFLARVLHTLLEFPLLSGENNKDYISDREALFELLRSFAANNGAGSPVHLLLFPEGWSLHDISNNDRKAVLAKSNEFAKREGRPQLKQLLLPRTTGFNASLESLRESSPVVYDITMAYQGYDGAIPASQPLSLMSLWMLLRGDFPSEIYFRIKRYSMEEVLSDASWLDKQWAEKDRVLSHFSRHQEFPTDNRGFCRHRIFDTRQHAMESSVLALARLLLLPLTIPVILFLSVPIFWTGLWMWISYKIFNILVDAATSGTNTSEGSSGNRTAQTPSNGGTDSAVNVTPFIPATPFVSPSIQNWRDSMKGGDKSSKR